MEGNEIVKAKKVGKYLALVVDDELPVVELIMSFLMGMRLFKLVAPVSDAQDARARITNQRFDLMVIDVNMPKLNGIELVSQLLEKDRLKASAVIIISGDLDENKVTKLRRLGVSHFVVKPFTKDLLQKHVNAILPNV